MTNMVNKAQGFGLSLITKMASSDILDQLKLRKFIEKSLYQGSKGAIRLYQKHKKPLKQIKIYINSGLTIKKNHYLI